MLVTDFDSAWVLFQGNGVLAVNKPAGVPVHRGTSHEFGVAEMIDEWVRRNPGVIEIRPGKPVHPAHRLDLEATGVLLFGLTRASASDLQTALASREVEKRYLAVVAGPVEALGRLDGTVRSKLRGEYRRLEAELTYRRLAGDERLSLVEVTPVGGRTHQIRDLFAQWGRPLAGDLRYGKPKPSRQFLEKFDVEHFILHARSITLPAGVLGATRTIEAPMPSALLGLLEKKGWKIE
jgi:23S rRNA-/tRNA-specific pseudouridylate synthase